MTNRPRNVKSNLSPSAKHWFSCIQLHFISVIVWDCAFLNSRVQDVDLPPFFELYRFSPSIFLVKRISLLSVSSIKNKHIFSVKIISVRLHWATRHFTWRHDSSLTDFMLNFCGLLPGWVIPRSRQCIQWWASGWSPLSCPRCQLLAGTTLLTASTPLIAASLWLRLV